MQREQLEESSFPEVLQHFRQRAKLTQQQLADQIKAHRCTVSFWERAEYLPETLGIVRDIAKVLKLNEEDERLLIEARFGAASILPLHNLPEYNPFFSGREEALQKLHSNLTAGKRGAPKQIQAISGLGGMGKTQLALEYAYRFREYYHDILWVQADSQKSLEGSYLELARRLRLPGHEEQQQDKVVKAVIRWLREHKGWLLILDNIEDLKLIGQFIPTPRQGSVILTTQREKTAPVAHTLVLDTMSEEDGALFLLKRAGRIAVDASFEIASHQERKSALAIVQVAGGLPLALDQAGAYIMETGCSLSQYPKLFKQKQKAILGRRGTIPSDHELSVTATFTLAFERIQGEDQTPSELLKLCAFLAPDAIPLELMTQEPAQMGSVSGSIAADDLQLNQMLEVLLRYSLVRHDGENRTLSIHRLVQTVLRDTMDEATKRAWSERAILAVNAAFPEAPFREWTQCERLLPHVLVCANWIQHEQVPTLEASCLFDKAGSYLRERGQYAEAKRLLEAAVSIRGQYLEAESLLATSLSNLAGVFSYQCKYVEAEEYVERALSIRQRLFGAQHPDTATSLSHLAILFTQQGKQSQAERLYKQALAIYEQRLGVDHLEVARTTSNLAVLYEDRGKYKQAKQLYEQALAIYEQRLEPGHLAIARSIGNLALISWKLGKYECAQALYQRAHSIQESENPDSAYIHFGLAEISREQGKYEQAENLYKQVLAIREQHLEADHPDRAEALQGLADLRREQGSYAEAEQLYQQALSIWEQRFGSESIQMTHALTGQAHLFRELGRYAEAEQSYQRVLQIRQQGLNPQHPDTAEATLGLAQLRQVQGRREEATSLYIYTLIIREQTFGIHHHKTTEAHALLNAHLTNGQRDAIHRAVEHEPYE